jgi:hypothetical protein
MERQGMHQEVMAFRESAEKTRDENYASGSFFRPSDDGKESI